MPIKNRHFGINVTGDKVYYDGDEDDDSESEPATIGLNLDQNGA